VRSRLHGGVRIRIGAMLFDEVSLKGSRGFVSGLERFVDRQVPRSIVNHTDSIHAVTPR
jgi:hypothetical protein